MSLHQTLFLQPVVISEGLLSLRKQILLNYLESILLFAVRILNTLRLLILVSKEIYLYFELCDMFREGCDEQEIGTDRLGGFRTHPSRV